MLLSPTFPVGSTLPTQLCAPPRSRIIHNCCALWFAVFIFHCVSTPLDCELHRVVIIWVTDGMLAVLRLWCLLKYLCNKNRVYFLEGCLSPNYCHPTH